MKMLQIAGGGHKTLKRGDLVPEAPENKIKFACKELLKELAPDNTLFLPTEVTILGGVQSTKDAARKRSTYKADVEITYRPFNVTSNRLFTEVNKKFMVECEDSTDEWGLETTSLVDHRPIKRSAKNN